MDEEIIETTEDGDELAPNDQLKKLREKLKKAVEEKQEYMDGWQRAKADFVNYRKREDESKKDLIKFANENLIAELTAVLDSFNSAFNNKEAWEKVDKNWRIGVEYISNQLKGILEQSGLTELNPIGQKFDPMEHHAIKSVEVTDPAKDGIIIEVPQKGFSLNGKVIRPAGVVIGELKKDPPHENA